MQFHRDLFPLETETAVRGVVALYVLRHEEGPAFFEMGRRQVQVDVSRHPCKGIGIVSRHGRSFLQQGRDAVALQQGGEFLGQRLDFFPALRDTLGRHQQLDAGLERRRAVFRHPLDTLVHQSGDRLPPGVVDDLLPLLF